MAAPKLPPPMPESLRPLPSAALTFSPAVVERLNGIEKEFGGRDHIIGVLACAPRNPEVDFLLNLVSDAPAGAPLADLCVAANVHPSELLQHLAAGNQLFSQTLSYAELPKHLPQTVRDLLVRSHEHEAPCDRCSGQGSTTEYPKKGEPVVTSCTACKGTGMRTYPPDPSARDKALELAGLSAKGPGSIVAVGVNVNAGREAPPPPIAPGVDEALRRAYNRTVKQPPTTPDPDHTPTE